MCYHDYNMGRKIKGKHVALISAIVSFISFAYKLGLGIYTQTLVLIIASISTLMVFICKVSFVKNASATRAEKKRGYLVMAVSAMVYSLIFILFVVLKINGIDITKENKYEGWFALIFIAFILLMFILSIYKLVGALEKNDIIVIGLKEMTFISALTDVVIIQAFISRIILSYYDLEIINLIDAYLPLAIGVIMTIVSIKMMTRFAKYES